MADVPDLKKQIDAARWKRERTVKQRANQKEQIARINDHLEKTTGKPGNISYMNTPEHFHLLYGTWEGDGVTWLPSYLTIYRSARLAYMEIANKAEQAKGNVEYYDEGLVMIETAVDGRTGLFRVYLGVGICPGFTCSQKARAPGNSVILLPGASFGRGKR